MGAWIGGSALLIWGVYQNFNALDEILKNPPDRVQKDAAILGSERVRELLRYTVGIENADAFSTWEEIQIGIGLLAAVLLFLESSTRVLSSIPLAMTLLVLFLHFKISPDLAWLHRQFAFTPWMAESRQRDQFWKLHAIYEGIEFVKCLFGIVLTQILFLGPNTRYRRKRRRRAAAETAPEKDPKVESRQA
jgi:hypothetical protein